MDVAHGPTRPGSSPATRRKALIGYARVSTWDQSLDVQIEALVRAGVDRDRIHVDEAGGAKAKRRGLEDALRDVREGDLLVVWKLDRLGRTMRGIWDTVDRVRAKGADLWVIAQDLKSAGTAGKILFTILATMAEVERDLIIERTQAGLRSAKDRGVKLGRPDVLPPEKQAIVDRRRREKASVKAIAAELGVSRARIWNYLRDKKEADDAEDT